MRILSLVALAALTLLLFIRLAPSDPLRWHRPVEAMPPGEAAEDGGHRAARRLAAPEEEVLEAARRAMLEMPRTTQLAGDVAEGRMTFVTRSALMGFPDYTTIEVRDGLFLVHARLRFGRSDLGVNRARVRALLAALGPLTQDPQTGTADA